MSFGILVWRPLVSSISAKDECRKLRRGIRFIVNAPRYFQISVLEQPGNSGGRWWMNVETGGHHVGQTGRGGGTGAGT